MPKNSRRAAQDPNASRMTLGEHLEELRWSLFRSLLALLVACVVCIWPAKYLLEILVRPLVLALRANGQPNTLLATNPVESIVVYIKVVLVFALILAAPYILRQLWMFVAAGLYPRERQWVQRLTLPSVLLFIAGVVFMYAFALLVSLNFLVGFSSWLPLPQAQPTAFERTLLRLPDPAAPTSQPSTVAWPTVPVVSSDPAEAPPGAVWLNLPEQRLKVRHENDTYSYQLQRDDKRGMVTAHFKIGEYLNFVLVLTIAFGLAFQLPMVVIFLSRAGIVPVATFRKYRKAAILAIVFIAGTLAPPDLLSHILLSGPMIALFEIGLLVAGRQEKQRAQAEAEAAEGGGLDEGGGRE